MDATWRLEVPGGWLYLTAGATSHLRHDLSACMCFVPNPAMVSTMPAHVPVPYEVGSDPVASGVG